MELGAGPQDLLIGLLDALYDNFADDLPTCVRFPLRLVLSVAQSARSASSRDLATLKRATREDVEKAIAESKLARLEAVKAAADMGELHEAVDGLHELLTKQADKLDAIHHDTQEAGFWAWRSYQSLQEFFEKLTELAGPRLQALHQLDPPVADFTGREAEIKDLLDNIQGRGATISGVGGLGGLQGMGGVGKTQLALRIAQYLKDQYPDAQFLLRLRGTDPDPLPAREALAQVVQAFHPTAKLPEDEGQLRGLYQSVLSGKRVLVLADNAASAQQVEPLIPPAGCVLLVTSRARFTLPGLFAKNLDTLPPDDARTLLLRIAKRIGEHASGLAELCGHLPLALRVAGSALAERPSLEVTEYLRRLTDERQRLRHLDAVDASLALSDRLLQEPLRERWYVLAVFPADFDRPAAQAVWELDQDAAQDTLDELVGLSLVEWSEKTRRFRLHDLVRLYVREKVQPDKRLAAEQRHAAHYLAVLRTCDKLYLKGGADALRGLSLFDLERKNIEAGFDWACTHAAEGREATELCNSYADAGAHRLSLRVHPRARIDWLQAGLDAARRLKDRAAEGDHLGNLGLAYADLGEPRRAIEFLEKCRAIHYEIGDRRAEGQDLCNLGNAYLVLGEARRAIDCYDQRLGIARKTGDRRGEGNALANLGTAYLELGEPRRAIEFYEHRLTIAREIGDRRAEGNALGNLGSAHYSLAEPRRAIEFLERALGIRREIGDRRGEGIDLGNLGLAYAALGEPRRAIELHEQALSIAREIGDRGGEARACWNTGLALEELGDLEQAAEKMQVRVDYEREIGHPDAEKHAALVAEVRARAQPKSQ